MKRSEVSAAQTKTRHQLEAAGLVISDRLEIEIADFGLNRFAKERRTRHRRPRQRAGVLQQVADALAGTEMPGALS